MASMSLDFILCKPENVSPPRTRSQSKMNAEGSTVPQDRLENVDSNTAKPAARRKAGKCTHSRSKADRQEHTRQLQNLRQRRYRERKKSNASALETNAAQLHLENIALETSIVERFKSQS